METNKGILLESGTNELEIVEFSIGASRFAINVIKVKEIINAVPVTFIPKAEQHIEGIIELRGDILPVVSIASALGLPGSDNPEEDKYIVSEFNQQKLVFHVHRVSHIHRISWQEIEKPSEIIQGYSNLVNGVIKINGEMVLLLDFEKIVLDISPESGINVEQVKKLGPRTISAKRILVAEDSPLLRKLLFDTLSEAGYHHLEFFENGNDAFLFLESLVDEGKAVTEEIQLVITDIEMPQMDGHHLTKKIKEHPSLCKLPVIIFSSLITDDLRHKGERVGADVQISKPEIARLVKTIDEYIL